jgi:signal transduction histidine kinase
MPVDRLVAASRVACVDGTHAARPGRDEFEIPLWRALAVFRLAALAYAALLMARNFRQYEHPVAGWVVIGVMGAWSATTIYGYARPRWRRWPLLLADLAVAAGCLLISPWIFGESGRQVGLVSVPVSWIAGPVLAWAVSGGRRTGAAAALIMGTCDVIVRGNGITNQITVDGPVLLLMAGVAVGHVARLTVQAQERLQRAAQLEAATRERERLARGIHDSVLQVLTMVQRRGVELGGASAELGRLAGEQEAALRTLIGSARVDAPNGGPTDLCALLAAYASPTVSLATPADCVDLPGPVACEVAAAVSAALANVREHCGPTARAWVLVEEDDDAVLVSVRDEGPGIAPGRLDQAAADGRLGVAQSIRGRLRELGGAATITSAPGQGTEVELRIPRSRYGDGRDDSGDGGGRPSDVARRGGP